MNGHPIDPFLAAWSAASGIDGFASRLRVYDVLELPGPWSRGRLKAVLASLLVPHLELRARFENVFELWFFHDDAPEQHLGPVDVRAWLDELAKKVGPPPKFEQQDSQTEHEPPQSRPKATRRPKRRWPWLVLIAFGLAAVLFLSSRHKKPIAGPTTQTSAVASVAASASAAPSAAPDELAVRTYPKLEFEVTEAPAPKWKKNLVAAAIGLLLLAIAVEVIAYLRRRRFDKPRVAPIRLTDETSELDFGAGSPPQPLSSAALDRLAYRTGLMPDAELPRLNVQKTVRATAKNAGSFVPAYDPRSQTRGLSIVHPTAMEPIAEAVFQCFVTGLQARGVPIHITTGVPRWDTPRDSSTRALQPAWYAGSMSLPIHADAAAQTYRYVGFPDAFPSQKSEGYTITPSGFWIPADRIAKNTPDKIEPGASLGTNPIAPGKTNPGSKAELLASLAKAGVTLRQWKLSGNIYERGPGGFSAYLPLTQQMVRRLNQLDEPISLAFVNVSWPNLGAIAELKRLTRLDISFAKVSDISALKDMSLTSLNLSATQVSDISALGGMPLTSLNLSYAKVNDISVLKGMPLTLLDLSATQVSDISVLKGMPLKTLELGNTRVTDVAALNGMTTLTILGVAGIENQVKDWSPLLVRDRPKAGVAKDADTEVTDTAPVDSSSASTENALPAAPKAAPSDTGTSTPSIPTAAE